MSALSGTSEWSIATPQNDDSPTARWATRQSTESLPPYASREELAPSYSESIAFSSGPSLATGAPLSYHSSSTIHRSRAGTATRTLTSYHGVPTLEVTPASVAQSRSVVSTSTLRPPSIRSHNTNTNRQTARAPLVRSSARSSVYRPGAHSYVSVPSPGYAETVRPSDSVSQSPTHSSRSHCSSSSKTSLTESSVERLAKAIVKQGQVGGVVSQRHRLPTLAEEAATSSSHPTPHQSTRRRATAAERVVLGMTLMGAKDVDYDPKKDSYYITRHL
nr:hypothetical protein [Talaromyces amestolkiae polymycovirus 1]